MSAHVFPSSIGGENSLVDGGSFIISLKDTLDKPDLDWVTGPPPPSYPSWTDLTAKNPPADSTHSECYPAYLPDGSNTDDPGPSEHWWWGFSKACTDAFGGSRRATPQNFSYQGKYYNPGSGPDVRDLNNGAGWRGDFLVPSDARCGQVKFACKELFGNGGDAKSGEAFQHTETCREVTADHKYHGGVFSYMAWDPTRIDIGDLRRRRAVPPRVQELKIPCGVVRIRPLSEAEADGK